MVRRVRDLCTARVKEKRFAITSSRYLPAGARKLPYESRWTKASWISSLRSARYQSLLDIGWKARHRRRILWIFSLRLGSWTSFFWKRVLDENLILGLKVLLVKYMRWCITSHLFLPSWVFGIRIELPGKFFFPEARVSRGVNYSWAKKIFRLENTRTRVRIPKCTKVTLTGYLSRVRLYEILEAFVTRKI